MPGRRSGTSGLRAARQRPNPRSFRVRGRRRCRRSCRRSWRRQRATAPDGPEWLHEIKFDGYRTLARIENGAVRLLTRNGHDWSDRYGDLGARPSRRSPASQALIDGEIIVQDEHGVSSFAALQEALTQRATHRLLFYAFDLAPPRRFRSFARCR